MIWLVLVRLRPSRVLIGIRAANDPSNGLVALSTVPSPPASEPEVCDSKLRSRSSYRAAKVPCHMAKLALRVVESDRLVVSLLLRSGRVRSLTAR